MIYQRISLATSEPIGEPGPLPYAVAGWPAELVADLSTVAGIEAHDLADAGFWPVVDEAPEFDPATQKVVFGAPQADPGNLRYVRQGTVEDLPVPVPVEISDRQFFHALALLGMITEAEALAAVKTGDPPAAMEAFLSSLPAEDGFNARMLLEGAVTFQRSHPLTLAFGAGMNMSTTQIDDLWRMASQL